jgi:hypothetical protein
VTFVLPLSFVNFVVKKRRKSSYIYFMIKYLTALLITSAIVVQAQTGFNYAKDFNSVLAKTKDKNDPLNYDKLLKRFKKNDSTLSNAEVLALLIGFTAKPDYKPYADLKEEQAVYNLNAEGNYYEGLLKANAFLKTHPFSVKVIFECSFSYYKIGKLDSAKFVSEQGYRIFRVMKYSGDGKTKASPIFALGPTDGEDYIYKFVSAGIGQKDSGADDAGNALVILEVVTRVNEPYYLHFAVQHAATKKKK